MDTPTCRIKLSPNLVSPGVSTPRHRRVDGVKAPVCAMTTLESTVSPFGPAGIPIADQRTGWAEGEGGGLQRLRDPHGGFP